MDTSRATIMKMYYTAIVGILTVLNVCLFGVWFVYLVPFSNMLLGMLKSTVSVSGLLMVVVYFLYPALLILGVWYAWVIRFRNAAWNLWCAAAPLMIMAALLAARMYGGF